MRDEANVLSISSRSNMVSTFQEKPFFVESFNCWSPAGQYGNRVEMAVTAFDLGKTSSTGRGLYPLNLTQPILLERNRFLLKHYTLDGAVVDRGTGQK